MILKKIRVLIVDDSAFMRKLVTDFLSEDERIEVVGTARNGEDGLKKVASLHPDVVTLDVEMPVMNGLQMLETLMKHSPVPVIMLSSTTYEGAYNTIVAMQYGAIEFIAKPSGSISLDLHKIKEELISKVILASRANIISMKQTIDRTHKQDSEKTEINSKIELSKELKKSTISLKPIVCIGSSTGGPRALQEVLTKLPQHFQAPIVIVQHMPAGFTKSLANRLDSLCQIHVKEAENGEILKPGVAYIAPGGFHTTVKKMGTTLAITTDETPPLRGHRPAVDVLFETVSLIQGYQKLAVILTGMGSDGTEGMKKLKQTGHTKVIAESEKTSVVYGMPKAAVATNLVDEIKDLHDIGEAIVHTVVQWNRGGN